MLSGPLGPIAIVADQPRACAEEQEVVGVGMDVPTTRVVRELTHCVMTQERPALEDDQRLITRPVGSRRDDAHVLEMVERGQVMRRVRGHGGIEPEQVQPRGFRGGHTGVIGLGSQPLRVSVPGQVGQLPEEIVGAVPVTARAVGQVHHAAGAGPGGPGQGQVEGVASRVPPPVVLEEIRPQQRPGQLHELEQVLDPVLPVANALVAGAIGPKGGHRMSAGFEGQADPAGRVVHLVEQGEPGGGQARGIDPEVILEIRSAPPDRAHGCRLVHRRGPLDERLVDGPAGRVVEVMVAPVIDQRQTIELMTRRQVHSVDSPQAPGRVAARGEHQRRVPSR